MRPSDQHSLRRNNSLRTSSLRRRGVLAGAALAALTAGALVPAAAQAAVPASAPATSATSSSSAGVTAAPGGGTFTPTFRDDFNGTTINRSAWGIYNGGAGTRASQNAIVHNGMLTLLSAKVGGQWTGAGISSARSQVFVYGKFEFRARLQRGDGTRACALLWPVKGWPPEVDFFEMREPTRTKDLLTNHYSQANKMQHAMVDSDYTQWHVVGLQWTPSALIYTLDGKTVATMTGHVPSQPMWLGFQTTTGATDKTTPAQVAWDIDYVQAWRWHA